MFEVHRLINGNVQHETQIKLRSIPKGWQHFNNIKLFQGHNSCCGYGSDGKGTKGFDCIIIPGAAKMTEPFTALASHAFCGQGGLGSKTDGNELKTVCSKYVYNEIDLYVGRKVIRI